MKSIRFIILFLLISVTLFSPVIGKVTMSGLLGVDLHSISYNSVDLDGNSMYDISRTLSSHYTNLRSTGSIASEEFSIFNLSMKIAGHINQTNDSDEDKGSYISPSINVIGGDITLFPKKRYPFKLFYFKSSLQEVRFENINRYELSLTRTGLSVIRRYNNKAENYGANLNYTVSNEIDVKSMYSKSISDGNRIYDFDEDRDIAISSVELYQSPTNTHDTIIFFNRLDDTVKILSGSVDVDVPPNLSVSIEFLRETHNITVIPLHKYNLMSFNLLVDRAFVIDIKYIPPPGTANRESLADVIKTEVIMGKSTNAKNFFTFMNSSTDDMLLRQGNKTTLLNNLFEYGISREILFNMLTSNNSSTALQDGIETSKNAVFTNAFSINRSPRRGIHLNLTHSFNHNANTNNNVTLSSNSHELNTSAEKQYNKYKHNVRLANNYSLFTTSTEDRNSRMEFSLINKMEIAKKKFLFNPINEMKLTSSTTENPLGKSTDNEFYMLQSLETQNRRPVALGDVKFVTTFTYIRKSSNVKKQSSKEFEYALGVKKVLSPKYTISASVKQKWLGQSSSKVVIDPAFTEGSSESSVENRSYLTLGLRSNHIKNLSMNINYSISFEPTSTNSTTIVDMIYMMPFINIPINSKLSKQTRELNSGLTLSTVNTEIFVKYNFRKIKMSISYKYQKEEMPANTFGYSEISTKITRDF